MPTDAQTGTTPGEEQRQPLREKHQVRLLHDPEDGTGLLRLPNGVYGYTYAPAVGEAPLFHQYKYQSFEVHKLGDGTVVLIGFVTPENAARIAASEPVKLRLLPDPTDQASTIVALPLWRIQRFKEYSARDGQGLEVELLGAKM
jgi:hypothetical protein